MKSRETTGALELRVGAQALRADVMRKALYTPATPSGDSIAFTNTTPAQAARQAAIKAFREKYPPSTPMIVGNIEEVRVADKDRELYAARALVDFTGLLMLRRRASPCP